MREYCLYDGKNKIEDHGDNAFTTFYSNAQKFTVNYSISNIVKGNFPHVGVTAREGLAILIRDIDENQRPVSAWKPVDLLSKKNEEVINLSHIVQKNASYQIAMYGPILAHLEKLSVIVNEEDSFYFKEKSNAKSRIFVGGVNIRLG